MRDVDVLSDVDVGGSSCDLGEFHGAVASVCHQQAFLKETPIFDRATSRSPVFAGEEKSVSSRGRTDESSTFNFQNALRHAALEQDTKLPELPWETPVCQAIFDEKHDPLKSVFPSFAEASKPVDAHRQEDLDKSVKPLYVTAVGHRQDVLWEEKREADLQRAFKKWATIVGGWPQDWDVCLALKESPDAAGKCAQLGHF